MFIFCGLIHNVPLHVKVKSILYCICMHVPLFSHTQTHVQKLPRQVVSAVSSSCRSSMRYTSPATLCTIEVTPRLHQLQVRKLQKAPSHVLNTPTTCPSFMERQKRVTDRHCYWTCWISARIWTTWQSKTELTECNKSIWKQTNYDTVSQNLLPTPASDFQALTPVYTWRSWRSGGLPNRSYSRSEFSWQWCLKPTARVLNNSYFFHQSQLSNFCLCRIYIDSFIAWMATTPDTGSRFNNCRCCWLLLIAAHHYPLNRLSRVELELDLSKV